MGEGHPVTVQSIDRSPLFISLGNDYTRAHVHAHAERERERERRRGRGWGSEEKLWEVKGED